MKKIRREVEGEIVRIWFDDEDEAHAAGFDYQYSVRGMQVFFNGVDFAIAPTIPKLKKTEHK